MLTENIKTRRIKLGLTQAQLAEATQLSQTCVAEIETGRKNPSLASLAKVAAALKTTSSKLLEGHTTPAPAGNVVEGKAA